MTTWEKLYKQSLKTKIKELSILQKEFKTQRKEIFQNRSIYEKEYIRNFKLRNKYEEEMYKINSKIKNNSRIITIYLDQLDQIKNNKKRNHLSNNICYYLDSKYFEFKLNKQYYALCLNVDVFEIYDLDSSITPTGFSSFDNNSFGFIKKDEIIQISENKEKLELILNQIQQRIRAENKDNLVIQDKMNESKQVYLKELKKLEKAIEKEKKLFEAKEKQLREKHKESIQLSKQIYDACQVQFYDIQSSYCKSLNQIAKEFK